MCIRDRYCNWAVLVVFIEASIVTTPALNAAVERAGPPTPSLLRRVLATMFRWRWSACWLMGAGETVAVVPMIDPPAAASIDMRWNPIS